MAARGDGLKNVGLVIVLVAACALPFAVSGFRVFQCTQVAIYAIALLGLNILTGYNGQFSLGHGAFYAIGAYTTAIMIDRWSIGYGWTIPVAGVLCLVVGFLFGWPALRLEGLYLALATFSLALALPQILKYFEHWTGGSQGIVLSKPKAPWGLPLSEDQWLYFLTLGILSALFVGPLSHVMDLVCDQGLALFAGLNVVPKRSYLASYSSRVDHRAVVRLMAAWFDEVRWAGFG